MLSDQEEMLPYIMQHVREVVASQILPGQDKQKIVTPFPPTFNDFTDFANEDLQFSDPQLDGAMAAEDAWDAYEFFNRTDGLLYNFSYGIRAAGQSLSTVCTKFTKDAIFRTDAKPSFVAAFAEQKSRLGTLRRTTVADLGNLPFICTHPGPVQWNPNRIVLNASDCARLKLKVLEVYENLENVDSAYLDSLIESAKNSSFSKIEYSLGFFDVNRDWVDADLFDRSDWDFTTTAEALYGENDPIFAAGLTRLCFAQRYHLVRDVKATRVPAAPAPTSPVPVRRPVRLADNRGWFRNIMVQQRFVQRNTVIPERRRAGFVWVVDHWEREKAAPTPEAPVNPNHYKIAAITCRTIPWKPREIALPTTPAAEA